MFSIGHQISFENLFGNTMGILFGIFFGIKDEKIMYCDAGLFINLLIITSISLVSAGLSLFYRGFIKEKDPKSRSNSCDRAKKGKEEIYHRLQSFNYRNSETNKSSMISEDTLN